MSTTTLTPAQIAALVPTGAGMSPGASPASSAPSAAEGPPPGWQLVNAPALLGHTTAVATGATHGAPPPGWQIIPAPSVPHAIPQVSTIGGILRQLAEGPERALGGLTDLSQGAINLGIRGINAATGAGIPQLSGSLGTTQWQQQHGGITQPHGEAERVAGSVGSALTSLPIMAGAGSMLEAAAPAGSLARAVGGEVAGMPIARAAAPVAVGAATGQGLADAVPPAYAPWANLAGNLVGGGVTALGQEGARALAGGAGELAGRTGIGPRMPIAVPGEAPIAATGPQVAAAANRLYAAGGEPLREALETDPLQTTLDNLTARAASPEAQTNPALAQELQGRIAATRQAIAARASQHEIVPGENPTLPQVAPLPGVVQGWRAAMMNPSEQFGAPAAVQRFAGQNAAKVGAIEGQAPAAANPEALGQLFVNRLDALDQRQAATEAALRHGVQGQTEALGGTGTPLSIGTTMTAALQAEQAPVVAARRALWQAVDPDGRWALQAPATRQAAASVLGELTPAAVGRIGGAEASILREAAGLPGVVRFRDLGQLRSDTNAAIREAGAQQGWQSPAVRRLELVKQGVDTDIQSAVSQRAAQERNAVLAGTMLEQDTTLPRLQAILQAQSDAWLRERQSAAGPGLQMGGGGDEGSQFVARIRPDAISGYGGAAGESGQGLGRVAGGASLPRQFSQPLEPNFPATAAEAYQAAVAATRDEKARFGQGVTGQILRAGRGGEKFRLPRSEVPGAVISGGASQAEDVANYLRATGGSSAGMRALGDAVVLRLRTSGAIQPDGLLDAKKFSAWITKHRDTLSQMPGLRDALGDARTAQEVLDRTVAEHVAEGKAFRDSIARRFIGRDPGAAVAEALSGRSSSENLNKLVDVVQGNPDAIASLKSHVVDFLLDKFAPESAAPAGVEARGIIRAAGFRAWINTNKAPLRRLFGGQGIQNLEMVTASLRRGALRGEAIPGSQTAPNLLNAARAGIHAAGGEKGIGFTVAALLGERLMDGLGGVPLAGAGLGIVGKALLDRLAASGRETINDLVGAAYLHPQVAKALLATIPKGGRVSGLAAKRLGAVLQQTLAAGALTHATMPAGGGQQ